MEVKMFKTITGDVIMCEIEEGLVGNIIAKKPVQLIMDPNQGGVGIIPYDAVFTQQEQDVVVFKPEHIIHYMPVAKAFEDSYIKFKTGIEVVS